MKLNVRAVDGRRRRRFPSSKPLRSSIVRQSRLAGVGGARARADGWFWAVSLRFLLLVSLSLGCASASASVSPGGWLPAPVPIQTHPARRNNQHTTRPCDRVVLDRNPSALKRDHPTPRHPALRRLSGSSIAAPDAPSPWPAARHVVHVPSPFPPGRSPSGRGRDRWPSRNREAGTRGRGSVVNMTTRQRGRGRK